MKTTKRSHATKALLLGFTATLLSVGQIASAKVYCLKMGSGPTTGYFKLNAKPVKKPSQFAPISGLFQNSALSMPLDGGIVIDADQKRVIELRLRPFAVANVKPLVLASDDVDMKLQGTYKVDTNFDGAEESTIPIDAINCKEIPL